MTPAEHQAQRDLVTRSLMLADTPEDRHGSYPRRKPRTVTVAVVTERGEPRAGGHVYVIPVVTEHGRLL